MSTQRQKEWYRLRRKLGRKPTREELDSAIATKATEGNKSNVAQQQHIAATEQHVAATESNKSNVATVLRPEVPTPKPERTAAPMAAKRVVYYGCIPVSAEG